jgi:hypothetical protein
MRQMGLFRSKIPRVAATHTHKQRTTRSYTPAPHSAEEPRNDRGGRAHRSHRLFDADDHPMEYPESEERPTDCNWGQRQCLLRRERHCEDRDEQLAATVPGLTFLFLFRNQNTRKVTLRDARVERICALTTLSRTRPNLRSGSTDRLLAHHAGDRDRSPVSPVT